MAGLFLVVAGGCAVPQPRGEGTLERKVEPTTQRGYWLYLPKEYVAADAAGRHARRWPLVVTFHGMKPFDGAHAQAREWEQEADRYGFIVIAPELRAPDVLGQFPVRKVDASFKADEEATLAVLSSVCAQTSADAHNVLATSWSSGGYMAHYMLNQHPQLFTCLAVRQSDYSGSILDPARVAQSRHHPILILNTQHDFAGVVKECKEAIQWYESHHYDNFAWIEIKDLGHERTPDMAAAFFAHVAGVEPNKPPIVLTHRQAIAGNPRGLALLANGNNPSPPVASARPPTANPTPPPTRPRATVLQARTASENGPLAVRTPPEPAANDRRSEPARAAPAAPLPPRSPVTIRVSSAIGTEPLVLAFSADCPADWQNTADFLWTFNGDPICSGLNGQKTITQPGEHTLGLLVVTNDGLEHRAYRLIRVLPHIESSRYPGHPDIP